MNPLLLDISLPSITIPPQTTIHDLPADVLTVVFRMLPKEDFPKVALVCREWHDLTIMTAQRTNSSIIDFITKIHECPYIALSLDQRIVLKNIVRRRNASDPINPLDFTATTLIGIKASILQVRERLLHSLKCLPGENFTFLNRHFSQISPPYFFEHFFPLARKYKEIDAANLLRMTHTRTATLFKIVSGLLALKEYKKAIEITRSISDQAYCERSFTQIVKHLISVNRLALAIETAQDPQNKDCCGVLRLLIEHLLILGNIDKAIELAPLIKDDGAQAIALNVIVQHLLPLSLDKAIEIAHVINHDRLHGRILGEIIERLLALGNIDKAIAVAQSIRCMNYHNLALQDIALYLLTLDKLDEAIEMAGTIKEIDRHDIVLRYIVDYLILLEKIDKANEIAAHITRTDNREQAFQAIHLAFP